MASVVRKVALNDESVSRGKRKNLCSKLRFRVLERDGYKCTYCGLTATEGRLEVDHVVPVSKGGTDTYKNLVTACRTCNVGKRDRLLGAPELEDGKPFIRRSKRPTQSNPKFDKPAMNSVWAYKDHPLWGGIYNTLKACDCDDCFYSELVRYDIAPFAGLHSWHLSPYNLEGRDVYSVRDHFRPGSRAGELA